MVSIIFKFKHGQGKREKEGGSARQRFGKGTQLPNNLKKIVL